MTLSVIAVKQEVLDGSPGSPISRAEQRITEAGSAPR